MRLTPDEAELLSRLAVGEVDCRYADRSAAWALFGQGLARWSHPEHVGRMIEPVVVIRDGDLGAPPPDPDGWWVLVITDKDREAHRLLCAQAGKVS